MGSNWYCKGFDESLFEIQKPTKDLSVGFDAIPNSIKNSDIFDENDLIKLASISRLPEEKDVELFKENCQINENNESDIRKKLYLKAKKKIAANEVEQAWKYLLIDLLNKHI